MAIPRGRLSSEPTPVPRAKGERAKESRHGGHHDGAEAEQAGLVNSFPGLFSVLALHRQGEIHHHDAVFLDDADQENHADDGYQVQVGTERHQGRHRPHPGRRER